MTFRTQVLYTQTLVLVAREQVVRIGNSWGNLFHATWQRVMVTSWHPRTKCYKMKQPASKNTPPAMSPVSERPSICQTSPLQRLHLKLELDPHILYRNKVWLFVLVLLFTPEPQTSLQGQCSLFGVLPHFSSKHLTNWYEPFLFHQTVVFFVQNTSWFFVWSVAQLQRRLKKNSPSRRTCSQ